MKRRRYWPSVQNRKDAYTMKRKLARVRRVRELHGGLPGYTEGLGGYYVIPKIQMKAASLCRIGKVGRLNIPTWRLIEQSRERRNAG